MCTGPGETAGTRLCWRKSTWMLTQKHLKAKRRASAGPGWQCTSVVQVWVYMTAEVGLGEDTGILYFICNCALGPYCLSSFRFTAKPSGRFRDSHTAPASPHAQSPPLSMSWWGYHNDEPLHVLSPRSHTYIRVT